MKLGKRKYKNVQTISTIYYYVDVKKPQFKHQESLQVKNKSTCLKQDTEYQALLGQLELMKVRLQMARVSKFRQNNLQREKRVTKKDYNFYPDLSQRNNTSQSIDLEELQKYAQQWEFY